jgi:hypothetical protein
MKLAAIYNVWDGAELLNGSIDQIAQHVDVIIIVYQTISNFGEQYNPLDDFKIIYPDKTILIYFEPQQNCGFPNECLKRNIGIKKAIELNCTHFLHMDCDEYYLNFGNAKQQFIDSGANGSVCKIITYFKKPIYRFETEDGYFVPFIHKLNSNTIAGAKHYPFYVDPTRKINEQNVIELDVVMQHYSWVRKDIYRKANNSSAKFNIEKGTMLLDYNNPNCGPGFYVTDYDKKLTLVDNYFNIII